MGGGRALAMYAAARVALPRTPGPPAPLSAPHAQKRMGPTSRARARAEASRMEEQRAGGLGAAATRPDR